jgi:hypothetical protein
MAVTVAERVVSRHTPFATTLPRPAMPTPLRPIVTAARPTSMT